MPTLSSRWASAAAAVAYLLTLPIMTAMYTGSSGHKGAHYLLAFLTGWIVFPVLLLVFYSLFKFIVRKIPGNAPRTIFLTTCAGAILAWHGVPGWLAIVGGLISVVCLRLSDNKQLQDACSLDFLDGG
jgi:hypothetical protein